MEQQLNALRRQITYGQATADIPSMTAMSEELPIAASMSATSPTQSSNLNVADEFANSNIVVSPGGASTISPAAPGAVVMRRLGELELSAAVANACFET